MSADKEPEIAPIIDKIRGYMNDDDEYPDVGEPWRCGYIISEGDNDDQRDLTDLEWDTVVHPSGPWILYGRFNGDAIPEGVMDTNEFTARYMNISWYVNMPQSATVNDLMKAIRGNYATGSFHGLDRMERVCVYIHKHGRCFNRDGTILFDSTYGHDAWIYKCPGGRLEGGIYNPNEVPVYYLCS